MVLALLKFGPAQSEEFTMVAIVDGRIRVGFFHFYTFYTVFSHSD